MHLFRQPPPSSESTETKTVVPSIMPTPLLKAEIYYLPRKATPKDVEEALLSKLSEVDPLVKGPVTKYVRSLIPATYPPR